jgi:hypothetical protein
MVISLLNLSIVILKNLVFNKVRNLWIIGRSHIMNVATEFCFKGLDMSGWAGLYFLSTPRRFELNWYNIINMMI